MVVLILHQAHQLVKVLERTGADVLLGVEDSPAVMKVPIGNPSIEDFDYVHPNVIAHKLDSLP